MCAEDGGVWDDTGSSLFVPGHCYDKGDPTRIEHGVPVGKHAPLGPGGLDANGNPAGSWANLDHWDSDGEPAGWNNPRLWKEGFFKHEPTFRGMAVIGVALVALIGGGVYLKKRKHP